MKKAIIILILTFFTLNLFSETPEEEKQADYSDYIVAAGEIFYINTTIAFANYAVRNEPFSFFNFDEIKKNFHSKFIWDSSSFLRNQLAHPYFGSLYFNASRSNNISFLPSLFYTAAGSLMWETIIETGDISINDIITTTFAGTLSGEVLYRLANQIYGFCKPLSWLINPFGSLNNLIRNQNFVYEDNLFSWKIKTKTGFSNYHVSDLQTNTNKTSDFYFPQITAETELIYNNPFGHKTNDFLDQFNLTLQAMGSLYNQNFAINIDGLLYSIPTYFYNDSLSNMGITYKYDIFNSRNNCLSNNSTGFTFKYNYLSNNKTSTFVDSELNYIFLSTLDDYFLYHNDNSINFDNTNTNYTFNYGLEFLLKLGFENSKIGNINFSNDFKCLFPYKNSIKDIKQKGFHIIENLNLSYEHVLFNKLYLGITDDCNLRWDINNTISNLFQFSNSLDIYFMYKIL